MMKNDKHIKKIVNVKKTDNKAFVLNNRFYCEYVSLFSKLMCEPGANARKSSKSKVIVYDYHAFKKCKGFLQYAIDADLNLETLTLFINNDNNEVICSINIVEFKVIDKAPKLSNLLKLIDFKPEHRPKDPIDSLDLSIVRFCSKSNPTVDANIEYTILGSLYYEVIEWNGIKDGEIIPIDSVNRKDIIHCRLTEKNMLKVAKKINKSLLKHLTKRKA